MKTRKLWWDKWGDSVLALTALEIKNAKTGKHADGNGLYLEVKASGSKSWIFRFTLIKRREMGIGSLSSVPATEARFRVSELNRMVANGIDPIEQNKIEKEKLIEASKKVDLTFMKVARDYIDNNRSSWKSAKHAQQWENTLATYADPVFKKTPIDQIDIDLVLKVLKPIWATKSETASRVRSRIEIVLSYAKGMKYRSGENPALWRGNLDSILPASGKVKNVKHQPALPYSQMSSFMAELRAREGVGSRALEFCILTALRSGAVRFAEWNEIDFDKGMWNIPAAHMKGNREHRVPLSSAAIDLLNSLPRIVNTTHIFPSPKNGGALSDATLAKVIDLINADRERAGLPIWKDPVYDAAVVPHGFRSTFRDWGAETTQFANEMLEVALAHAVGDKTEAAYRRGDMIIKRQQLMEDWARYCEKSEGNVVSIKKLVK